MIITPFAYMATQAAAANLLLDDYPDAAFAFSVRKLNSDYTGSCIEVRRTSDNTTQDIGFDGDELDTTSLLAFVGTGASDDGFITTWYDQSGNGNDLSQTTNASQPKIMDAGAVLLRSGKPALDFNTVPTDSYMDFASSVVIGGEAFSVLMAASKATNNDSYMFNGNATAARPAIISNYDSKDMETFYGPNAADRQTISTSGMTNVSIFLIATSRNNPGNIVGRFEGAQAFSAATAATLSAGSGFDGIGSSDGTSNPSEAQIAEWVVYFSDKASDLSGMQDNQNAYWNKY